MPSPIRTLLPPPLHLPPPRLPHPAAATTAMVRSPSAASKPPCAAFQSHPTDLELVNSYLRPWVETGLKAGPFIHEADVYAADPADLTRRFAPAVAQDGERAWYFFTPLRHKSVRGKRKARTVASGGGCWHNEAKSKPVFTGINGKRQIGHRQSFSFVKKDGGARLRTGWLMMELRLLKDGAAGKGEGALGNLVLCKVYRSPRNPEPGDRDPAPAPALKEEAADDDGSSAATADDDDSSSSDAPQATAAATSSGPTKGEESSEATVAAPSRHSKADGEIPVAAAAAVAPGCKEKAAGDEDSAETSAAAPPARKRKAPDDESSGAAAVAAPAPKRSSSSPGAPAPPSTELQCPHCGTHLVVTLKKPETKSETEITKDEPAPGASDAPPTRGEARGSSEKNLPFHHFL